MRIDRVVLDTNVLISAIHLPYGKPFACLNWVLDNATLIASRELLDELESRLARPKFAKYVDEPRRRANLNCNWRPPRAMIAAGRVFVRAEIFSAPG